MGTYVGVYGLHIHTWDACMSENSKSMAEERGVMCMCMYVCVRTSYPVIQVYAEDKIKIMLEQQAGSQRSMYTHCYHQGDEWGRSEAPLQDLLWE